MTRNQIVALFITSQPLGEFLSLLNVRTARGEYSPDQLGSLALHFASE